MFERQLFRKVFRCVRKICFMTFSDRYVKRLPETASGITAPSIEGYSKFLAQKK